MTLSPELLLRAPPLRLAVPACDSIENDTVTCHRMEDAEAASVKKAKAIRLDLTQCKLSQLPPAALQLRQLTELAAVGNRLCEVPPMGACSCLRVLSLGANQLTSAPETLPPQLLHLG